MEFNNPAIRLHSILLELSQARTDEITSSVLSSALGVQNEPKELMRAIVEFHNLVQEVKEYAVQKTTLPTAPLTRYIPQIDSAVAFTNFDAAWGNYKSRISTECLVIVEMIAYVDNVIQDHVITGDELRLLTESIQDLFDEIESNSALDKEFRMFLLKQMESIRRAIAEYRISGASGFSRYLERLITDSLKDINSLKKAEKSAPSTLIKFKKIVKKVAEFASFTTDGLKAIKNIKNAYDDGMGLITDLGTDSSYGSDIPEISSNVTMT